MPETISQWDLRHRRAVGRASELWISRLPVSPCRSLRGLGRLYRPSESLHSSATIAHDLASIVAQGLLTYDGAAQSKIVEARGSKGRSEFWIVQTQIFRLPADFVLGCSNVAAHSLLLACRARPQVRFGSGACAGCLAYTHDLAAGR